MNDNGHRPIPNFDPGPDLEYLRIIEAEIEARVGTIHSSERLMPGGAFVLDGVDEFIPLWGDGDQVAWAEGESLWICGPQGVAKSTVMQNVALRRHGILDGQVLGMSVNRAERPGLYLAMDRPLQIKRSLRRMVGEEHRAALDANLVVWKGPPPADLAKHTDTLVNLCDQAGVGTVYIDSLKDAAVGLSDDEVGSGFNRAIQTCLANGIEVIGAHHQRKGQQGGTKPTSLDDVYGSTWITSGAGSVVLLWAKAGDAVMEFMHLKPPAEPVGPFKVFVDFDTGAVAVDEEVDLWLLASRTAHGLAVEGAARALFGVTEPDRSQIEKARRKLERHPSLEKVEGIRPPGGGTPPSLYRAISNREEEG